MSIHTIQFVKEFHNAFGHPIEARPTVPSEKTRLLRFRLIFEELMEFGRAIGIQGLTDGTQAEFEAHLKESLDEFRINRDAAVSLADAADALADLDYVVQGSNLVFGFPAELIVADVHAANMSKLGPDGRPMQDANGKIIKGPNTRKPYTVAILAQFMAPGTDEGNAAD